MKNLKGLLNVLEGEIDNKAIQLTEEKYGKDIWVSEGSINLYKEEIIKDLPRKKDKSYKFIRMLILNPIYKHDYMRIQQTCLIECFVKLGKILSANLTLEQIEE